MVIHELTGPWLRLRIHPGLGGRIISVCTLATGREWLIPPPSEEAVEEYGASYTDRRISGWDEMVPTIDPVRFNGVDFPDHGELWAVPWRVLEADETALSLAVVAHRGRLALKRSMAPTDRGIEFKYQMMNVGERAFPAWWAAHPMFVVGADARIELPEYPSTVSVTSSPHGTLELSWGEVEHIVSTLADGEHVKARFGVSTESWASIRDGEALTLAWAGESIKNFAILWDNRGFTPHRTIAFEPSTADADALDRAARADGCPNLSPGSALSWRLHLSGGGAT